MSHPTRELAMELLLKGAQPDEVAATIGTDVTYIMALQGDEEFQATLRAKRATTISDAYDKDSAIENLEVLTLSRMTDMIACETDIGKLTRAFHALNKADRRSQGEGKAQQGGTVVELVLPAHITQYQQLDMQKNHQGEVVSVDGRLLQTQDTQTVMQRAAERSPLIARIVKDQEAMENVTIEDL